MFCVPVMLVALLLVVGSCTAEDAGEQSASGDETGELQATTADEQEPSEAPKKQATKKPEPKPTAKEKREPKPTAKESSEKRTPAKTTQRFLVNRVIDGDTVELGNGRTVRLLGIDTPERGECGFDRATDNLVKLVEGKTVRLTRAGENTDRYDRLLRYVDIGDMDAGLRLIKNGHAIARYDSRDGYGFHPREPRYIAADEANPQKKCAPKPQPEPAGPKPANNCASGYTPCVPPYPPDVNCADVNGPIRVTGSDPHGLDADGDGTACES